MQQRNYLRGLLVCLVPCALFGAVAWFKPTRLGIDLAGGTILVYEVDVAKSKKRQELLGPAAAADTDARSGLSSDEMARLAEALKRRIDPVDTKNVIIRPVGDSRIEILLPFSKGAATKDGAKEAATEDFVQFVKDVVSRVGRLEFRILANDTDDSQALADAETRINELSQEDADKLAKAGVEPPPPAAPDGYTVTVNGVEAKGVRYAWVELGKEERDTLGLSNRFKDEAGARLYQELATNRGKTFRHSSDGAGDSGRGRTSMLLYSRPYKVEGGPKEDKGKEIEYFVLTRVSEQDRVEVGGPVTLTASAETDPRTLNWIVSFRFNAEGGRQFGAMTERNKPVSGQATYRNLAVLLDNKIVSAPTINSRIDSSGQISGKFDKAGVDQLVYILRSGALTAELKPNPVSESTVGPTLGRDTINKGLTSVVLAFAAVMLFMLVYYRFAGVVACVALLANLLLTVGFMVSVNAAFTLAGMAGIVLMLGMAVDANVLIYERLREEREKGATLAAAIRAGYDRAFPTIIDTHLSSIFTAVILFAFGNDNLKGFAVSLTVGLVISLFTSLYMTRLIFDYAQHRRWLTDLRMMQLFKRPNINFMALRNVMFVITGVLTVIGLGLFLVRGNDVLNVDFRGGTVYGGRLAEPRPMSGAGGLLELLGESNQQARLKVKDVRQVQPTDRGGRLTNENTYEITYEGEASPSVVSLANAPASLDELKARAGLLPDVSVEQVFLSTDTGPAFDGGKSASFTVRTTEKEQELVQVMLDRLLRTDGKPLMDTPVMTVPTAIAGSTSELTFSKPVSVKYVEGLLKREFELKYLRPDAASPFVLEGVPSADDTPERQAEVTTGKYARMRLDVSKNPEFAALAASTANARAAAVTGAAVLGSTSAEASKGQLLEALKATKATFESRPVPERLETFDAALAGDTQAKALYAILASWVAILMYLWFRFGSWQFGLAAVVCLIHDLCFTLGAIAVCHYLHAIPGVSAVTLIQDFKIDLAAVAALLTLIGFSVNDTIVVFDRIREVRGKNPLLTPQMINDSVNQTLSRTVLASLTVFLVVGVLYGFGGEGVHLFSFVMVVGVLVGTYSSIYVASPLLLIFGEGKPKADVTTAGAAAVAARR